ncbi:MAG: heme o synthase [Acidiferrobacter sp.]
MLSYCELTKPRVVSLLIFTAMVGMLLASPTNLAGIHWAVIFWANVGIAFASGAAAAINHVVDRQIDGQMKRTHSRPLPNDAVSVTGALVFATLLMAISVIVLVVFVNQLTAILTMAGLVGYAGIYTGFLKRRTPQNIVLGGAAGAIPPVLGWAAVTGHAPLDSWVLFLIIFLWTPAHFWPLAIYRREEYARVGIPMMPVTRGVRHTSWLILGYTIATVAATELPFFTKMAGIPYLIGANLLGAGFLYHAIRLIAVPEKHNPMRMFGYSIAYLAALFALLLGDHYLLGL